MEFSSTLATMLHNPHHINYLETWYNSEDLTYILKDNTLFKTTSVWCRDFRQWLVTHNVHVPDSRRMYTPVAKLMDGELIGYNTQFANIGNKFLEMSDSVRKCHYDNLYFVEIGNHPYPKQARYHHSWIVENYLRDCHRIINPPSDPNKFFIQPSFFSNVLQP